MMTRCFGFGVIGKGYILQKSSPLLSHQHAAVRVGFSLIAITSSWGRAAIEINLASALATGRRWPGHLGHISMQIYTAPNGPN